MTLMRAFWSGAGLAVSLGLAVSIVNGLWAHLDKDNYTWTRRSAALLNGNGNGA